MQLVAGIQEGVRWGGILHSRRSLGPAAWEPALLVLCLHCLEAVLGLLWMLEVPWVLWVLAALGILR